MHLDPADLALVDRYKLAIGCIVPRPIAFVSSMSPEGRLNLAPFSFFNGVCSEPMSLLFCVGNTGQGGDKDTLRNVRSPAEGGTGEFVVNAAVESYRHAVAAAAEPLEYGESEFSLTGLTPAPSQRVRPPRVGESPVTFECETLQIVTLGPGRPGGGNIVIGRVVHVFVRDDLIDERYRVDADRLQAIGRMGGRWYCRTADRFEMPVGREALGK